MIRNDHILGLCNNVNERNHSLELDDKTLAFGWRREVSDRQNSAMSRRRALLHRPTCRPGIAYGGYGKPIGYSRPLGQ